MYQPAISDLTVSVRRSYSFDAAHKLDWHPGKCRNLHGHTYRLEVEVFGFLDHRGVVMDFAEIDEVVKPKVIERLDHRYLNDIFDNPTAEIVALSIAEWLSDEGLSWSQVRLWETESGSVLVRSRGSSHSKVYMESD